MTGSRTFLEPLEKAHPLDGFSRLHELVTDNAEQQARFAEARRRYEARLASIGPALQMKDLSGPRGMEPMLRRQDAHGQRAGSDARGGPRRTVLAPGTRRVVGRIDRDDQGPLHRPDRRVCGGLRVFVAAPARRDRAHVRRSARRREKGPREATEAEAWIRAGQAKLGETVQWGAEPRRPRDRVLDRAGHVHARGGRRVLHEGAGGMAAARRLRARLARRGAGQLRRRRRGRRARRDGEEGAPPARGAAGVL